MAAKFVKEIIQVELLQDLTALNEFLARLKTDDIIEIKRHGDRRFLVVYLQRLEIRKVSGGADQ